MKTFNTITQFPEIFVGFCNASLIRKAIDKSIINIDTVNLRDFAQAPHFKLDDTPYGGGAGMVMLAEPVVKAVNFIKKGNAEKNRIDSSKVRVIYPSASGQQFKQADAERLSKYEQLIFICGRFEGLDQRAIDQVVDEEFSIGDYVLMGGEVASMVMIEAISRLVPGVLGNLESAEHESFGAATEYMLEAPHYTKPQEFQGMKIPEVLLSGDHKKIKEWRKKSGLEKTLKVRPDMLKR